ncbi:hypothetical protein BN2476_520121 [Paraburkholderia piptadeniae]|uniref:Uncharacterized protein n=1 Tax=Paraburkholderia piptadeniae TaxID=1701573 RepID=A0A1N7SH80_9BURK|nr:hypothetical protein BN2476_520121 [Paraburkholderia piptadeniae]
MKEVAALLRNTPAVCKRCYIHPEVIAAFEAGELQELSSPRARRHMKVDEVAFAALLAQGEKKRPAANRRARKNSGNAKSATSTDVERARLAMLQKKSGALQNQANSWQTSRSITTLISERTSRRVLERRPERRLVFVWASGQRHKHACALRGAHACPRHSS